MHILNIKYVYVPVYKMMSKMSPCKTWAEGEKGAVEWLGSFWNHGCRS